MGMWTAFPSGIARNFVRTENKATSTHFINSLPDLIISSKDQLDDGKECAVCLKAPELGDTQLKLPCSHKFHKDCVMKWLQKINSCPMCRCEFPKESQGPIILQQQPVSNTNNPSYNETTNSPESQNHIWRGGNVSMYAIT